MHAFDVEFYLPEYSEENYDGCNYLCQRFLDVTNALNFHPALQQIVNSTQDKQYSDVELPNAFTSMNFFFPKFLQTNQ